ncbi:NUDIX domain-containing protein [Streptomyces zingiberis]|uniref:NUDIX hydrolase n=1 Tax=Streptomyces zingiberis TaxID=2053010 RepID=A0ABX1C2G7_9ACTN|nr:NUDIX domain-containing protein [Streptomyces zingiberis]NJQ01084.1 NUDIX hydrolase [Streptomyces zingiberis]
MKAQWITAPVPGDLPVRQVYGFLFDAEGRVLVQDDEGYHNLPGGKPEFGEDFQATLFRESVEESQVEIGNAVYLGYVRVEEPNLEPYVQVRMTARITRFLERAPDVSTGRLLRRLMTSVDHASDLLAWGDIGVAQTRAAAAVAPAELGITLAAPDAEAVYVD